MYIEPKKRIVKALSRLLEATQHACSEYGCSLSWNTKGSTERNFRSRIQTMQNQINQFDIDWDDEYSDIDENADELVSEIDEIINDLKLMVNPSSWDEVIDMQISDAETAVKKFGYYN